MTEINPEHQLDGLKILTQSKKHNGKFLIAELNDQITKIVKGIRQAPNKGGSLNISMKFNPASTDAEIIVVTADVTSVKVPTVEPRPIHAFTTMSGAISSKDPSQSDFLDEAQDIDTQTGEVKEIKGSSNNIKSIK